MYSLLNYFKNKLIFRLYTYYIFENINKISSNIKIDKKFKFIKIDKIEETKFIDFSDYKINLFLEEGIKKKARAFCITHNNNLVHVTWTSNSNLSKAFVDDKVSKKINWNNTIVWGRAFTHPNYRKDGLYSFAQQELQKYFVKSNLKYQQFTIKRSNITSINAMKKFDPKIVKTCIYIRLYKYEYKINIPSSIKI